MYSDESIKVSVVVPVFNVEKYLEKCINSVLNQSLADFELIAIDDKSTDNSLKILKDFQKMDKRIRIFENKKNMGPSYCRNLGIREAKGKYLEFIDSDDWIEENCLELLYNESESKDLDFIMFPFAIYDDKTEKASEFQYSSITVIDSSFDHAVFSYDAFDGDTLCKIAFSPVNKLYNLDFLRKNGFKFLEGVDVAEDLLFFYEIFLNASRVSMFRKIFYYYRIHVGSISTTGDRRSFDVIKVIQKLIDLFKIKNIYERYKKDLLLLVTVVYKYNFNRMDKEYRWDFLSLIKKEYENWGDDLYDPFNETLWSIEDKCFYLALKESSNLREFELAFEMFHFKIIAMDLDGKYNLLNSQYSNLLNENQKLKDENNTILSSNSWKLTKPLRKFTKKLK